MTIENKLMQVVDSANRLTEVVNGKIIIINQRVDDKIDEMEHWKNNIQYQYCYYSSSPEVRDIGVNNNWHIVKLASLTKYAMLDNCWLYFHIHGRDIIGKVAFLNMTHRIAYYTGYKGRILISGNPNVKFYMDKSTGLFGDLSLYIAVQNSIHKNANVELNCQSAMKLDFQFVGALTEDKFPKNWVEIENI